MGRFLDSLKSTYATPTLRGLRVAAESHDPRIEPGDLWPWLCVEQCGDTAYRLLNERGERETRGSRSVVVTLRGPRLMNLARRAQERAFRLALFTQESGVRFTLPSNRCSDWTFSLLALGLTGYLLAIVFRIVAFGRDRGFHPDMPHHDDAVFLSWSIVIGFAFCLSIYVIPAMQTMIRARRVYALRARFGREGLCAVRRDRSRTRCAWSDLVAADDRALTFVDGTRVEFRHGSRRLDTMIAAVTRTFFGSKRSSDVRQLALLSARLLFSVALACVVVGIVLRRAAWLFPHPNTWLRLWLILMGIAVLLAVAPWFHFLCIRIGEWIDVRERRKQRAERAEKLDDRFVNAGRASTLTEEN